MNDAPNDAPIAGPNDPVPAPPIRDPVQIDANIVAAAAAAGQFLVCRNLACFYLFTVSRLRFFF